MPQDDYNYPKDEFDQLGANRAPQAVHRAPRPWWRVWGPLIAVVILVPILAFALIRALTSDDNTEADPTPTTGSSASETAGAEETDGTSTEPSADASTEESTPEPTEEESTPEPTEEATTEAPLDYATPVSVLNGAGVSGLAGRTQERLVAAGWTAVEAGNYQSGQPEVSTVYYANAELADAAAAVAAELGITPVTELADVASITVVLRSDFTE